MANNNFIIHSTDAWYCREAEVNEISNKNLLHYAIDCIKNDQISECIIIVGLAKKNIINTIKFFRSMKRTYKLNVTSVNCIRQISKNIVTTCLYYWIICKIIKIIYKNRNINKN